MGGDVVEIERALPFLGAALAERQQPAKPAVSGAVARIGEQARRVLQIEPGADDEFDPPTSLAARWARTTPASVLRSVTAMAVEPERLCRRHQLLGMGAAAQEGEIGGDVELGVAGHGECRSLRRRRADTSRETRARSPDRGLRGTPSSGARPRPRCGNSRAACGSAFPPPEGRVGEAVETSSLDAVTPPGDGRWPRRPPL